MGKSKKSNENVEARAVNGRESSNADKPWVANYPPLATWLEKINAACIEQHPIGPLSNPIAYLERWMANGRVFVVEVRSNRRGWNVYTARHTNRIDETLANAERDLEIVPNPNPADDMFRWTVEFEVAETWVADGFDLTDQRAIEMLSGDLRYANVDAELGAKVITAPDPKEIRKAQGYDD
jgi:hypothetical protein